MIIRLSIAVVRNSEAPPERRSFQLLESRTPWKSFFFSAVLHCLIAPVLPALLQYLPTIGWVEPAQPMLVQQPLLIRMPERLYLRYSIGKPLAAAKQTAKEAGSPASATVEDPGGGESGYRTYATRKFEIPVSRRLPMVEQTLLQPQIPLMDQPREVTRLPHLAFWSPQLRKPPAPRPFVAPGRQVETGEPSLIVPPKLDLPNQEPRLSELQIGSTAAAINPALPAPPAGTMPLRTFDDRKTDTRQSGAIDRQEGDPTAVLALNSRPAAPALQVTVPAASQAGGLLHGGASNGAAAASKPGRRLENREVPPPLPEAESPAPPLPPSPELAAPVRMVHPENGVFDVVLVQASPEHAMIAEGPVPLSGRPIYTVYLQVGGPKEWILQYCVPQSSAYEVKSGGAVVQLGNPAPVKAPFPRVTVLPPAAPRQSRLVLHGFLTEQGSLRGLDAIVPHQKHQAPEVIPYLQQWEFRPATRDGRPVEIEIVLIIPAAA